MIKLIYLSHSSIFATSSRENTWFNIFLGKSSILSRVSLITDNIALFVLIDSFPPFKITAFDDLIAKAERANYPMLEVRQGTLTLNVPTRTFREQVYEGNILHAKNTILTHAVNNAIIKACISWNERCQV